jgi:tetratricopeptide (TPR) repeat protein
VFVGQERKQIVADLVKTFESVAEGSGSKFVCLASLPGTGKTRIVQEFFAALAATHDTSGYWPKSLIPPDSGEVSDLMTGRKRVYPQTVVVRAGAKMPWMWWGLSCAVRDDGQYSQVMFEDATQISAHAAGIVEGKAFKGALASAGFDATSSVLGVLGIFGMAVAPPVGIAIVMTAAAKAAWDHHDLVKQAKQAASSTAGEVDALNHGRSDDYQKLVDSLVAISRKVPTVIVLDDAHWADQGLITVIEGLLRDRSSKVLFVATTWPHALERDELETGVIPEGKERLSPFATWWTQNSPTPSVERIDLLPLASRELAEVLYLDADWLTEEAATALLAHIGNNPLTARVLLRTRNIRSILQDDPFSESKVKEISTGLDAALALYWAELPEAVRGMLALAAQLGATYVPAPVIAAATAQGIEDAEASLIQGANPYAWASELEQNLFSFVDLPMHQIARDYGRNEWLTREEIEGVRAALVDTVFSADFSELSPHVRETLWAQHVDLADKQLANRQQASGSAAALAELSAERYAYKAAIEYAELALRWSGNPNHPDTLRTRNNLANWYGQTGDITRATTHFEAMLPDQIRILGPDHPQTLTTRNNFASMHGEAGDLNKAISLFEALLEDQIRILGNDHPDTLPSRSNLAFWSGRSGDVNKAIALHETLLADQTRILGPDHPSTLTTRNNLASLLGQVGDLNTAITQFRTLLADQTRILGQDHPSTLTTRGNLASMHGEAGDPKTALTQFRTLLADQTRILGQDHPDTLATRSNIASWTGETGDPNAAITIFATLLADQTRILGQDHPHTLATRNNLASWAGEAGDPNAAITQLETILTDQIRISGPDHPHTLTTRNNLASWSGRAGDLATAITLFQAVLEDQTRLLGKDHPHTLRTRHNLAYWSGRAGDVNTAISEFQTLLPDQIRILGPDHPQTLTTRSNLAFWFGEAGDLNRAITQFKILLADQIRILGQDHPDTLQTRNNIASLREEHGDLGTAITLFKELLKDQTRILGPDHPNTLRTRRELARLRE